MSRARSRTPERSIIYRHPVDTTAPSEYYTPKSPSRTPKRRKLLTRTLERNTVLPDGSYIDPNISSALLFEYPPETSEYSPYLPRSTRSPQPQRINQNPLSPSIPHSTMRFNQSIIEMNRSRTPKRKKQRAQARVYDERYPPPIHPLETYQNSRSGRSPSQNRSNSHSSSSNRNVGTKSILPGDVTRYRDIPPVSPSEIGAYERDAFSQTLSSNYPYDPLLSIRQTQTPRGVSETLQVSDLEEEFAMTHHPRNARPNDNTFQDHLVTVSTPTFSRVAEDRRTDARPAESAVPSRFRDPIPSVARSVHFKESQTVHRFLPLNVQQTFSINTQQDTEHPSRADSRRWDTSEQHFTSTRSAHTPSLPPTSTHSRSSLSPDSLHTLSSPPSPRLSHNPPTQSTPPFTPSRFSNATQPSHSAQKAQIETRTPFDQLTINTPLTLPPVSPIKSNPVPLSPLTFHSIPSITDTVLRIIRSNGSSSSSQKTSETSPLPPLPAISPGQPPTHAHFPSQPPSQPQTLESARNMISSRSSLHSQRFRKEEPLANGRDSASLTTERDTGGDNDDSSVLKDDDLLSPPSTRPSSIFLQSDRHPPPSTHTGHTLSSPTSAVSSSFRSSPAKRGSLPLSAHSSKPTNTDLLIEELLMQD